MTQSSTYEKIAVVILNYNSSADCRKCVSFLKKQSSVDLEIIIVDNCSKQDDFQEVRKLSEEQNCTFIPVKENRGYNAGNNVGLRYAVSKGYNYALIANPDMEFPQTDYLEKIVNAIKSDDKIAVVGTDIITPYGTHQNPLREYTYQEELLWFITYLKNRKSNKWLSCDYKHNTYCEKISGCCLLIKTSFLNQIGFFDENVFLYSEESILAKQVKLSGMKAFYLADAQAVHYHIESQKGASKPRMKILFKSRNYYLTQYSGYKGFKLQLLLFSRFIQSLLF